MYYKTERTNENSQWVLFIHGIGGSIQTWKYQTEDFSEYNRIFVDLQGHGRSGFKKTDRLNPHKKASGMIAEILERENIKKVHIVALSLGTITALEFMKNFPEYTESAVLGGCVVNFKKFSRILFETAELLKNIIPVRILYPIFALIIMPKEHHKKSRQIFVRESLKMKKEAFSVWCHALLTSPEQIRDYAKISSKKPVLFVSGTEDYIFNNGLKDFGRNIKNFRLKFIKKCGHACSIEKHAEFNRLALRFIKHRA